MSKFRNTPQRGSIRYLLFKEDNTWYAVGLEFNIVESGDTAQEAILLLFEALAGYVEAAKRIKARANILNQKPDSEYEEMWQKRREEKFSESKQIFSSGEFSLGQIIKGIPVPA